MQEEEKKKILFYVYAFAHFWKKKHSEGKPEIDENGYPSWNHCEGNSEEDTDYRLYLFI